MATPVHLFTVNQPNSKAYSGSYSLNAGVKNFTVPLSGISGLTAGGNYFEWILRFVQDGHISLVEKRVVCYFGTDVNGNTTLESAQEAFAQSFTGSDMPGAISAVVTRSNSANFNLAVTVGAEFEDPVTMNLSISALQ